MHNGPKSGLAVKSLERKQTQTVAKWEMRLKMGAGGRKWRRWWQNWLHDEPVNWAPAWKVMDGKPQCEKAICCLLFV